MEMKGIFDSLYDKLILRDIFGKVVPGTLLISAVVVSLSGPDVTYQLIDKMTFVLWMAVIGFAWLIGFALQYIGERLRLLRTHPPGRDSSETRQAFYPKWAKFQRLATDYEKLHAERLNVIKEACGNASISLLLTSLVFCAKLIKDGNMKSLIALLFVGFVLAIAFCLWRMHIIHVERYGEFVENTIQFRDHNRDSDPK
jgi:hypothetical protein